MRLPWQKPERGVVRAGYADFEPLISDRRLHEIGGMLVEKFRPHGLDESTEFVTFVQPATTVDREGVAVPIPEVGVFAVITDNPRAKGHQVMTQAAVWLKDWRATDAAKLHFVSGSQDPAFPILQAVVRTHLQRMKTLREMNP